MRSLLIKPEQRRQPGCPGAIDGQFHPVPNRQIPGLAHAPDVTLVYVVLKQDVA